MHKNFNNNYLIGLMVGALLSFGLRAQTETYDDAFAQFEKAANFQLGENPYLHIDFQLPKAKETIEVTNSEQLQAAVDAANKGHGSIEIVLAPGVYKLNKSLLIKQDNIAITSKSGIPENTIIEANGMFRDENPKTLIRVYGQHFTLDGITLQKARHHLLQIAGEHDADYVVVRNCIFRDAYQQLLKVSYDKKNRPEISADFGLIEHNKFYYQQGIGPNYYIGGVDAHAINNWLIQDNHFEDIASPDQRIAEHAIHIWNNSYNTVIRNNTIKNCDRGIGLGMKLKNMHPNIKYSNLGGLITGNTIVHTDKQDPFADAAIILEDSPYTQILDNQIWMSHYYPRAIEYRYKTTIGLTIAGNVTNRAILSRNGAKAVVKDNTLSLFEADFFQSEIKPKKQ